METIKQQLVQIFHKNEDVLGAVILKNKEQFPFHVNEYEFFLLILTSNPLTNRSIRHVEINGERVFIRVVHLDEILNSTVAFRYYNLMDWLISGEIILDKSELLVKLKNKIEAFPVEMRDYRKFLEYCGFLETLYIAKRSLHEKNELDAYSQILLALHHWARIVLIEEGLHPELTVWKQLRKVHPGVYKLYEELIASPETITQMVELVMLACEFSVTSKMKDCCKYLLDLLAEREEPWSIAEINNHPRIEMIIDDITLVIRKLVQGHHLKEVAVLSDEESDQVLELKYIVP